MHNSFYVVLTVIILTGNTEAWKHFWRGKLIRKQSNNLPIIGAPPDQWFEQKLDHFNVVNTKTWKQRYFTNDTFFKGDGPVFLMIGGEGEASPEWMLKGMWIEWGSKFNALCFQLEHRFYGKSHPTKDMSTKNLKFLSSEQALADLAYFIESKQKELKLFKNRWIVFGGSYPGSLAAWFRLKYPHLAFGAVASSAPLLAKINFKEYLGVVTNALQTTQQSSQCTNAIEQATSALEDSIQSSSCCQTVEKLFRLCDPLDVRNGLDVANLFETLAGNFEGVVQYNKDNREFKGSKGTNITIDVLCNMMTDPAYGSPLARYAEINNMLLDVAGDKCLDYKYDKMLKDMRLTDWNSSASAGGNLHSKEIHFRLCKGHNFVEGRQWTYQTCTEFGYYQSSDLEDQPFGNRFPIDFSIRQCSDIFGKKFNYKLLKNAIIRTNAMYGGLNLKVDRTVFPNGSVDPWSALGFTNNQTGNVAIFIQGTAHCADMYPPSIKDSMELVQARKVIERYLHLWVFESESKI